MTFSRAKGNSTAWCILVAQEAAAAAPFGLAKNLSKTSQQQCRERLRGALHVVSATLHITSPCLRALPHSFHTSQPISGVFIMQQLCGQLQQHSLVKCTSSRSRRAVNVRASVASEPGSPTQHLPLSFGTTCDQQQCMQASRVPQWLVEASSLSKLTLGPNQHQDEPSELLPPPLLQAPRRTAHAIPASYTDIILSHHMLHASS